MIDRACISISAKCPLSCTYCHFDRHIDKSEYSDMTNELLEKILTSILEYANSRKTKFKIGLVGSGEPLLRFDLIKFAVDFARKFDVADILSFYTISNGIPLDSKKIIFFFENKDKISLNISLDGPKHIHDKCRIFRNGEPSFKRIMQNLQTYRHSFGKMPSVNATVHRITIEHQSEVLDFFETNFSEVCFSRLVDVDDPEFAISRSEFATFMDSAVKRSLSMRQTRLPLKYDCTMYGQLCGVGRTNIFFIGDDVFPCGRFVGNRDCLLGHSADSLFSIEDTMIKKFPPCDDGLCWYDTFVEVDK